VESYSSSKPSNISRGKLLRRASSIFTPGVVVATTSFPGAPRRATTSSVPSVASVAAAAIVSAANTAATSTSVAAAAAASMAAKNESQEVVRSIVNDLVGDVIIESLTRRLDSLQHRLDKYSL